MVLKEFFVFCSAYCITFFLIPPLRLFALKKGILDLPNGALKTHAAPTAYLGGVAVYFGVLPFLIVLAVFDARFYFLLIGLTFLLILGLVDDVYEITPLQKFIGQLIAGICFIQARLCFTLDILLQFFPSLTSYFSEQQITFFAFAVTLFWIATVINAFNLIDIMDGLLATLSICITVSWWVVVNALNREISCESLLLIAFLGSMAAFFWYNKPKASIFMGDAGSLFVGGFLSIVPFMAYEWQASKNVQTLIFPLFIFSIPLMEVICLVIIRTMKGIPFYYGSPHHFISYLKKRGWVSKKILLFTGGLSLFFSAAGFFVAFFYKSKIMLLFSLPTILFLWGIFIFRKKQELAF